LKGGEEKKGGKGTTQVFIWIDPTDVSFVRIFAVVNCRGAKERIVEQLKW